MRIKLTDEEIKKTEYNILKDVALFCEKNNIHYILIYGTLLGAIRHGGFIPWDDDVDIAIPRDEYDFFIKTYKSNRYRALDSCIDKKYPYAFGKIVDTQTIVEEHTSQKSSFGVYIDVFPIDIVPYGIEGEKQIKKSRFLCRCALYKLISLKYPINIQYTILHAFMKMLLLPFSQQYIVKKQVQCAKSHVGINSDLMAILTIYLGCKQTFDKDLFYDRTKVKFEDEEFYIPRRYDEFLKKTYGDYMIPPPENKRGAHFLSAYYL